MSAGVEQRRVDGVLLRRRLVPRDRIICRKRRRVVVAQVGVDTLGQVFDVRPSAFQPNAVAPLVRVVEGFLALRNQLFGISRCGNDKPYKNLGSISYEPSLVFWPNVLF